MYFSMFASVLLAPCKMREILPLAIRELALISYCVTWLNQRMKTCSPIWAAPFSFWLHRWYRRGLYLLLKMRTPYIVIYEVGPNPNASSFFNGYNLAQFVGQDYGLVQSECVAGFCSIYPHLSHFSNTTEAWTFPIRTLLSQLPWLI